MSEIQDSIITSAHGSTFPCRQVATHELNASLQDGPQAQLATVSLVQPGSIMMMASSNGNADTDTTTLEGTPTRSDITAVSPLNTSPATVTSATPVKHFTCFLKLPPELREKIWKFTLPSSRVIAIFKTYVDMNSNRFGPTSMRALYDNPMTLCTNQESRAVIKRLYTTVFQNASRFHNMMSYFYFDFSRDTLCFGQSSDLENYMRGATYGTRMQIYRELKFLKVDTLFIVMSPETFLKEESARNEFFSLLGFWRLDTLFISRVEFLLEPEPTLDFELITEVLTRAWQKEISEKGYLAEKLPRIVWLKDG